MSEYVIMPKADYQNACDTLRAPSGSTALIKSGDLKTEIEKRSATITKLKSQLGKAVFKSTNMPSTATWQSVTYGDGKFVAVAYNSDRAAYSLDGATWISATLPTTAEWTSVTYGDGKFIAIDVDATVAYSTDGIAWTNAGQVLPTGEFWYSVTYGAGKFVAVSTSPSSSANSYGAYSTDGINWTRSYMINNRSPWKSVTYGDGKFVAVASNYNFAAYSTDGVNWSQSRLGTTAYLSAVACGGGKIVAVDGSNANNTAFYSVDGITWSSSTLPDNNYWRYITYGAGKFVAIGEIRGYAAYSSDAINWTLSTTLSSKNYWRHIAYGDNKFVALGNSDAAAYCDLNVGIV